MDNIVSGGGSANLPILDKEINNFLIPKYLEIIKNNYYIGKSLGPIQSPAIYLQSAKETINEFHTHIESSILTCVFYLCLPEEEGGIELNLPPSYNYILQPQLDKLYIFPSYISHRPLGQKSKDLRISINWGYDSNSRILHKKWKEKW